ncbi:MAG TPA: hypothetical protein VIM11_26810 [Tepidisphaeraceae bacterium]|jgi:hypothetical protein
MSGGYFINSLKGWKKDFEREQRRNRKRLETLRGMEHPCADDQEQLINIRDGWIKQIEQELANAVSSHNHAKG